MGGEDRRTTATPWPRRAIGCSSQAAELEGYPPLYEGLGTGWMDATPGLPDGRCTPATRGPPWSGTSPAEPMTARGCDRIAEDQQGQPSPPRWMAKRFASPKTRSRTRCGFRMPWWIWMSRSRCGQWHPFLQVQHRTEPSANRFERFDPFGGHGSGDLPTGGDFYNSVCQFPRIIYTITDEAPRSPPSPSSSAALPPRRRGCGNRRHFAGRSHLVQVPRTHG